MSIKYTNIILVRDILSTWRSNHSDNSILYTCIYILLEGVRLQHCLMLNIYMHVYQFTLIDNESQDTFLNFWFCSTYKTCIDRKLFVRNCFSYWDQPETQTVVWLHRCIVGYCLVCCHWIPTKDCLHGHIAKPSWNNHRSFNISFGLFYHMQYCMFSFTVFRKEILWNHEQKWWLIICGSCGYF